MIVAIVGGICGIAIVNLLFAISTQVKMSKAESK
jgi:hypothetical protein